MASVKSRRSDIQRLTQRATNLLAFMKNTENESIEIPDSPDSQSLLDDQKSQTSKIQTFSDQLSAKSREKFGDFSNQREMIIASDIGTKNLNVNLMN